MRLTWLADELRRAGLRVVEVDGWKTRGSDTFDPEGMTWHATAGSRTSSAQGEVNVILTGSATAPAPISQLMLYRDGTIYVCAAGRCNHNKVGWDGPNKGLGNSRLIGMEMANDNRGEPWPAVQLDAARRATAAILKRLNVDPMRRLAAHYEHQPYATRPPGEGSTKSDPFGVDMTKERPRVAALMEEDDMPTAAEIAAALRPTIRAEVKAELTAHLDDIAEAVWDARLLEPTSSKSAPTTKPAGDYQRFNDAKHLDTRADARQAIATQAAALKEMLTTILIKVGATGDELASFNQREREEVPITLEQMVQLLDEAIPDSTGPLTPDEARDAVLGALRTAFAGDQS